MTSSVVTVFVQHEWRHNAGHQASSSEPDLVLTFGYYGMLILERAECRGWQIHTPEKLDGPPPALKINRWFLRQIDALQMELGHLLCWILSPPLLSIASPMAAGMVQRKWW